MEMALTLEVERLLADAVATGRFADPAEAVAEGLCRVLVADDAEADLPRRLGIGTSPNDSLSAPVVAELDRAAEDVRLGRTEMPSAVLERMDVKISAYLARRDAGN